MGYVLLHTFLYSLAKTVRAKMHSNRMRTARLPTVGDLVTTTKCQYYWRYVTGGGADIRGVGTPGGRHPGYPAM